MRFFVAGTPVSKGSAKAFVVKGKAVVTQDNAAAQKPWASSISWLAHQAMQGRKPTLGPVEISLIFTMPRLQSHYGTGRNSGKVKDGAPVWHTSKPDLDKLVRCVKDALTGVVWKDDSQVASMTQVVKVYGDQPGVTIIVNNLDTSMAL